MCTALLSLLISWWVLILGHYSAIRYVVDKFNEANVCEYSTLDDQVVSILVHDINLKDLMWNLNNDWFSISCWVHFVFGFVLIHEN